MTEQTVPPESRADGPAPVEPAPVAPVPAEPVPVAPVPVDPVPADPAPAAQAPAPADFPPMPTVAPVVPVPDGPEPSARTRKPRRVLRAVARWTVAVLVLGAASTGTAYQIASMERTDVPGLSTVNDGRWDYPALSLPALPPGKGRPFDSSNDAEIHYADVRDLLLPAPAGSVPDKKLTGGWVSSSLLVSEFAEDDRSHLAQVLQDSALRHTTARGWTMPDGTSSRIHLLQFNSVGFSTALGDELTGWGDDQPLLDGTTGLELDESWPNAPMPEYVQPNVFTESKPYEKEHTRVAYVVAGDTLAVIVQSHKGSGETAKVPFQQTVILQDQLLG
ncbi:hypothetical protein ACWCWD_32915 [Streptomyces sp. NPDC001493]